MDQAFRPCQSRLVQRPPNIPCPSNSRTESELCQDVDERNRRPRPTLGPVHVRPDLGEFQCCDTTEFLRSRGEGTLAPLREKAPDLAHTVHYQPGDEFELLPCEVRPLADATAAVRRASGEAGLVA